MDEWDPVARIELDWLRQYYGVNQTVVEGEDGNYTVNLRRGDYAAQATAGTLHEAVQQAKEKLLAHLSEELGNDG